MKCTFDIHVDAPEHIKVEAKVTVEATVEEVAAQLKAGTENLKEILAFVKDMVPVAKEIMVDLHQPESSGDRSERSPRFHSA